LTLLFRAEVETDGATKSAAIFAVDLNPQSVHFYWRIVPAHGFAGGWKISFGSSSSTEQSNNETFTNEKGATFVITFYIVWRSLFPRYSELIAADDPQVTDLHMTTHLTL